MLDLKKYSYNIYLKSICQNKLIIYYLKQLELEFETQVNNFETQVFKLEARVFKFGGGVT